jgi:hypothetical protein
MLIIFEYFSLKVTLHIFSSQEFLGQYLISKTSAYLQINKYLFLL